MGRTLFWPDWWWGLRRLGGLIFFQHSQGIIHSCQARSFACRWCIPDFKMFDHRLLGHFDTFTHFQVVDKSSSWFNTWADPVIHHDPPSICPLGGFLEWGVPPNHSKLDHWSYIDIWFWGCHSFRSPYLHFSDMEDSRTGGTSPNHPNFSGMFHDFPL